MAFGGVGGGVVRKRFLYKPTHLGHDFSPPGVKRAALHVHLHRPPWNTFVPVIMGDDLEYHIRDFSSYSPLWDKCHITPSDHQGGTLGLEAASLHREITTAVTESPYERGAPSTKYAPHSAIKYSIYHVSDMDSFGESRT
jgi:hypothetical protein